MNNFLRKSLFSVMIASSVSALGTTANAQVDEILRSEKSFSISKRTLENWLDNYGPNQIKDLEKILGLEPNGIFSDADMLVLSTQIKDIQRKLAVNDDGIFGPGTLNSLKGKAKQQQSNPFDVLLVLLMEPKTIDIDREVKNEAQVSEVPSIPSSIEQRDNINENEIKEVESFINSLPIEQQLRISESLGFSKGILFSKEVYQKTLDLGLESILSPKYMNNMVEIGPNNTFNYIFKDKPELELFFYNFNFQEGDFIKIVPNEDGGFGLVFISIDEGINVYDNVEVLLENIYSGMTPKQLKEVILDNFESIAVLDPNKSIILSQKLFSLMRGGGNHETNRKVFLKEGKININEITNQARTELRPLYADLINRTITAGTLFGDYDIVKKGKNIYTQRENGEFYLLGKEKIKKYRLNISIGNYIKPVEIENLKVEALKKLEALEQEIENNTYFYDYKERFEVIKAEIDTYRSEVNVNNIESIVTAEKYISMRKSEISKIEEDIKKYIALENAIKEVDVKIKAKIGNIYTFEGDRTDKLKGDISELSKTTEELIYDLESLNSDIDNAQDLPILPENIQDIQKEIKYSVGRLYKIQESITNIFITTEIDTQQLKNLQHLKALIDTYHEEVVQLKLIIGSISEKELQAQNSIISNILSIESEIIEIKDNISIARGEEEKRRQEEEKRRQEEEKRQKEREKQERENETERFFQKVSGKSIDIDSDKLEIFLEIRKNGFIEVPTTMTERMRSFLSRNEKAQELTINILSSEINKSIKQLEIDYSIEGKDLQALISDGFAFQIINNNKILFDEEGNIKRKPISINSIATPKLGELDQAIERRKKSMVKSYINKILADLEVDYVIVSGDSRTNILGLGKSLKIVDPNGKLILNEDNQIGQNSFDLNILRSVLSKESKIYEAIIEKQTDRLTIAIKEALTKIGVSGETITALNIKQNDFSSLLELGKVFHLVDQQGFITIPESNLSSRNFNIDIIKQKISIIGKYENIEKALENIDQALDEFHTFTSNSPFRNVKMNGTCGKGVMVQLTAFLANQEIETYTGRSESKAYSKFKDNHGIEQRHGANLVHFLQGSIQEDYKVSYSEGGIKGKIITDNKRKLFLNTHISKFNEILEMQGYKFDFIEADNINTLEEVKNGGIMVYAAKGRGARKWAGHAEIKVAESLFIADGKNDAPGGSLKYKSGRYKKESFQKWKDRSGFIGVFYIKKVY